MLARIVCSGHVAVTLALSATAEKAGSRPEKAKARNTLSCQGPYPPPAPRFETHAGLAAPSPGNRVHILFWSVGDLFTQRSRFLLHTHFMLQKQKERDEVCAWSWFPSPGGEGEMPGVCLNIYHILVLVRLGERKVYREGTLFNVFTVFPPGVCVTASQGRPLECPSPRPGGKPPGAHTATWWWPNTPAPLLSPIFHPMEPRPWRDHPTSAHFQRPKGCGG